jgi:hypothetical protein
MGGYSLAKKNNKPTILRRLTQSLALFYPELAGQFMCPTCLRTYPVAQPDKISDGHIIPRAAGGGIFTPICKEKCNDVFGARQDKWFGEYVRLLKVKDGSILHTKPRRSYIEIDGVRVGATYQITQQRGLEFFIEAGKTSPEALSRMMEAVVSKRLDGDTKGRTHTISVPIPLLQNQDLVYIGFLTAAYLMWFRELGYSWALQEHLGPIRDQIRNPTEAILPRNFLAPCRDQVFERPWIGVGRVGNELSLLAGLANGIVFLPPADTREFYGTLGDNFEGLEIDYRVLRFYEHHAFGGPVGVLYGDRLIVVPDIMMHSATAGAIIYFPIDGGGPHLLYPMSQDEYKRRGQATNVPPVTLNSGHVLPKAETGRPSGITERESR